eukprot:UN08204
MYTRNIISTILTLISAVFVIILCIRLPPINFSFTNSVKFCKEIILFTKPKARLVVVANSVGFFIIHTMLVSNLPTFESSAKEWEIIHIFWFLSTFLTVYILSRQNTILKKVGFRGFIAQNFACLMIASIIQTT